MVVGLPCITTNEKKIGYHLWTSIGFLLPKCLKKIMSVWILWWEPVTLLIVMLGYY